MAGRLFDDDDRENAPGSVVVNEALARRYLSGAGSALGKQLAVAGQKVAKVVGVVSDFRARPDSDPEPTVYLPALQAEQGVIRGANLLVRTVSDPMALAGAIRRIASETPRMDVIGMQAFDEQLSNSIAPHRFQATLLVTFASVALLLAIVGAYGVLSYAVTERTQGIGVRMALGAHRGDVFRMVLTRGLKLVIAGVMLGLLASLALTRLMTSLLYGVKPYDTWTLAAVSFLLVAVSIAAACVPARRAVRVDPVVALRYE